MGLEYRVPATLQQKALRDLHKSFYIFATVIVFFAILGFLFIVWYYGALQFSGENNNNNTNDTAGVANEAISGNSNSSRNALLRANPVVFRSPLLSTNQDVGGGGFLKQEVGVSGMFENTRLGVWVFSIALINVSVPTGGFSTVTKHNAVMLVDARKDSTAVQPLYYTDLLMEDMYVTSMVGIGPNVYLFYSKRHSNTYGIGKLLYNNNKTLTFSIVYDDILLPGPVIMATTTNTHVLLYYQQGVQVQVLVLPRYVFEVMVHNGQLWASFKLDHNSHLDTFALLNITNPTSLDYYHRYPLMLDDGDGETTTLYSLEWNEYLAQYVMLSATDNRVDVWYSSTPQGPFTVYTSFFTQTVSNRVTHTYFHKEMWRGAGRTMVFTYCIDSNSGSLAHLAEIE